MRDQKPILIELSKRRKLKSVFMTGLLGVLMGLALVPLFLVFSYVVQNGYKALNWDFFTQLPTPVGQAGGGMANALVGSMTILGLAALVAVPFGISVGAYLSEYGQGKLANVIRFVVDLLTSVPSIVIGLFVYAIAVAPFKTYSGWAGALAYGLMMMPIVIKMTEEVLKLLPQHVREAGLALGLSRRRVIISVVLNGSRGALATGVLLAVARVIGETAPLLFTAFGNRFWASSMNQPMASLPVQIYSYAISPYEDWHRQAWAGAFLLILLVFVVNLGTRIWFKKGVSQS